MKFGKNDDVNYFKPSEESGSASSVPSEESGSANTRPGSASSVPGSASTIPSSVNKKLRSVRTEPKTNESELILLITTIASGVLISKFVI